MNARILELIKNPEIIQNQDLDLLNSEIKEHPYLQNIRAIHLFGTHKFDTENYQKELSVTAAYTTDKKILYQLINKKTEIVSVPNNTEQPPTETQSSQELTVPITFNDVILTEKQTPKPVFVEGHLNRILFEGEEDFLERENEKIDIESTVESGKIVTQSIIKEDTNIPDPIEKPEFTEAEDAENFTPETIVNELAVSEEETVVEDLSKISFHGLEEFLPDVKIKSTNSEVNYIAPKPPLSKQELEMQRLIAEVETKVKASKKEKVVEVEPVHNHDINFSESQKMEVAPPKNEIIPQKAAEVVSEIKPQNKEIPEEKTSLKEEITEKPTETEKSAWKPMQFSGNTPDSLIDKKNEAKSEETTVRIENSIDDKVVPKTSIEAEESEERPVLNVSFLTQKVSSIESPKQLENEIEEPQKVDKTEAITENSNVTNFINTWQTWLKIDRKEEITEEKPIIYKVEVKNTVIEKFIEKEPKISKLKEESDFVVKEKGSNISHLMTETLANLYVEQKLYAKAIKAYETLATKHPQKENLFKEKIQQIKELRKNP